MKKLFSLLLPLTLIACDKTETYEFKFRACCDAEKCIEDIKQLTYKRKNTIFVYKDYKHCNLSGYCHTSDYMEAISSSDAIKISPIWGIFFTFVFVVFLYN